MRASRRLKASSLQPSLRSQRFMTWGWTSSCLVCGGYTAWQASCLAGGRACRRVGGRAGGQAGERGRTHKCASTAGSLGSELAVQLAQCVFAAGRAWINAAA